MLKQFLQSLQASTRMRSRRQQSLRRRQFDSRSEVLEQRSLLSAITVTTRFDLMDPDDGLTSLREALAAAADEATNPGHDTITFDVNLGSGMIHADYGGFDVVFDEQLGKDVLKEWYAPNSGGEFVVDSDVTIDGSSLELVRIGHERGWAERHRIFRVDPGVTATFRNVVVQGGDSNNEDGGGIWNAGNLTLENSVVGSNYALSTSLDARGGGIFNAAGGVLTLKNTHVGEVALTGDFLNSLGVSEDFYVNEEASERTRYGTFVYRGESVVGKSTSDPTQISGNGSAWNGGGIYNEGELHVTDRSVIRGNRTDANLFRSGAGVFNAGLMTITDSTVADHERWGDSSGTAYGSTGAGIYNTGILEVTRSTFRNNVTNSKGGAIYNAGLLSIRDTVFDGNAALRDSNQGGPDPEGGAIYDEGTDTVIRRSTFSGGTAKFGGAIVNDGNPAQVLDQVTIAGNASTEGGGILIRSGTTELLNSTIANNSATTGSGGGVTVLGGASTLVMQNSVIAANEASTATPDIRKTSTATLTSLGHNLIQTTSGYTISNGAQPSDLIGVDAHVGQLGDGGGLTQTVGLLPASPAIDSGQAAARGFARNDYQLQGSLNDSKGGVALTSYGGSITSSGYTFNAGQGLALSSTSIANDQYSIEMRFQINNLTPYWKKVIDFDDRATDWGIYIGGDSLVFYGTNAAQSDSGIFSVGTEHHLVLTRTAATNEVVGWVDGVEVIRFVDAANEAVFDAADGALQFFRDDTTTSGSENVGGTLSRLRLYGQVLSQDDIEALADNPDALTDRAVKDQRGFLGTVGRGTDRGATETIPPTSMRVDSLEDVVDGAYGAGQLSLREAIQWANQIPGADEIAFSADLANELAEDPDTLTLALGQFTITDDLAIYGPGADRLTISGAGVNRIFEVSPGTAVELVGLTLTEGLGADRGGAVYSQGELTLREMRITGNTVVAGTASEGYGGGVASYGTLLIEESTIDNNSADANGGGLYNWGTATVINSTVSGNAATSGGGVFTATGSLLIESATIAKNTASSTGGGFRRTSGSTLTVLNSIIADNTAPDGPDGRTDPQEPIPGSYNIIGDGTAAGFTDGVNNNQVGTTAEPINPLLGRLRLLGGPTPVHGLLPGSPAIEAASSLKHPRFDQRGVARPIDLRPDAGAFEYAAPVFQTNTVVVDSLDGFSDGAFDDGQMSLTEAVLFANDDPSLTRIVFDPALFPAELSQPIVIEYNATEEFTGSSSIVGLNLTSGVDLIGPGAEKLRLQATGAHRVLTVGLDTTTSISGMTIAGGNGVAAGGGLINYGDLTLTDMHFVDNEAAAGGGLLNMSTGDLLVTNSTFSNNHARVGGGGLQNSGVAVIRNVTVSGNTSDNEAGGVRIGNGAETTIQHVTITNNSAVTGGGLSKWASLINGSTITLINSIIAGNIASTAHPDVDLESGTVISQGGNIFGVDSGFAFALQASDQSGTASNPTVPFMTDLTYPANATVPVHALLPTIGGNIAVNSALNFWGLPTDQRGVARNTDGGFDTGAFELGPGDRTEFTWESELVVDRLDDTLDAVYSPGEMTLREALLLANAFDADSQHVMNGVAYDVIRFSDELLAQLQNLSPADRTLQLARGPLEVLDDVIIDPFFAASEVPSNAADLVVIDGMGTDRVFLVSNQTLQDAVHTQIHNLTVQGGYASQNSNGDHGGGILSYGDLSLSGVTVRDNTSFETWGGGLAAMHGSLDIRHSSFVDNRALLGGGVLVNEDVPVRIAHSTFELNQATVNSIVATYGGGLLVFDGTTDAAFEVTASTFSRNYADIGGGIATIRSGEIDNSTISTNTAETGGGFAVVDTGVELTLSNVTVTGNETTSSGGGFFSSGLLQMANTILYGNSSPDAATGRNTGTVQSLGHNIFESESGFVDGGGTYFANGTDLIAVDPELGPLGDNGGPTLTHALQPTSPAIDAGAAEFTPLMDQRGFPVTDVIGVGSGYPDIGAYEIQTVTSSPWQYAALDRNQFGPGEALSFGFGYDDAKPGNDVRTKPYFLGFEFDTGQLKIGDIVDGPLGTKFGAELNARFAGKLGFEVGFYVNAGSVDVAHYGEANYVIDPGADGSAIVSTYIDVNDGGLYTVSPKVGAYADLVVKLDADVSAYAALFGVVGGDLIDIHVDNKLELFSLNRQMEDRGRPLFMTDSGQPVSRDPATGKFYDLAVVPQEISDPGLVIPLLDGDIRYFSLGVEEIVEGVIESAQAARDLVNYVRAVRELNEANSEAATARNERDRLNKQLDNAAEQGRKTTSLKAQQEMTDLAGPEYATAVAQGKKGDELPEKQGKIRNAENSIVTAEDKRSAAEKKVQKKKNKLLKNVSAGVVIDTGKVTGSMLGAEVKIGVGVSLGLASITKNIGTMQLTLPDVNLRDSSPDALGQLSASTSDFRRNSAEDLKRQIASAKIDLGAFIPGFPGGSYNVSLGPLSLDVTTVSYNVGPQLNVTQDVQARPVKVENGLTYHFFDEDGVTPEAVQVIVNGVPYAGGSSVQMVTFNEGDRVEVTGNDGDGDGRPDPVVVKPTMKFASEFSNDIGLDMDLDGSFRAFGLSLSALGETLIDIGPLISHDHTISTTKLGSVFNKTFGLGEQTLDLEPFTLFNTSEVGRTPATAIRTQPSAGTPDVSTASLSAPQNVPVFVTVDQLNASDPDQAFTVLEVESISGGVIASVEVLDDRLKVTGGTGGNPFQISGYSAESLEESGTALLAVRFQSNVTGAEIQVTRSNPISLSAAKAGFGSNSQLIGEGDFERVGTGAVLNNDIDGDGLSLPETDGVLMIRYLAGFTGDALTVGALGSNATRTDPEEIANFIGDVLERALPQSEFGTTESTLDFDGDGGAPTALGDGVLLARYLDGRRGTDLIDGVVQPAASRQSGTDIVDFIEVGRASANGSNRAEFAEVVDRTGADVFGLNGKQDADPDAVPGSSSTAAQSGTQASGGGDSFLGDGGSGPAWEFVLDTFGQVIDIDELYLNSISPENLMSRVAVGSPTDFGKSQQKQFLDTGLESNTLVSRTVQATLGVDEPLFITAPDAGGYEYVASAGFQFTGFTIDPEVAGNLYQSAEFDLYLYNTGSGQWEFDRLVTSADSAQLLPNGHLQVDFGSGGVSAFRLYSLALPNRELHDDDNSVAPVLDFNTGLRLAADPGTPGSPTVTMMELAPRLPFGDVPVAEVESPVFASDPAPVSTQFVVVRTQESTTVTMTTTGIGVPASPLQVLVGSTAEIELRGNDNVSDVALLDLSNGPLRVPVRFNGGFRLDTLVVSGADGVVDLIDRSDVKAASTLQEAQAVNAILSEVEMVDLRGTGDITLLVDADAVLTNDPWHRQLYIRRDAGDSVSLDSSWELDGNVVVDGVSYSRQVNGRATIYIESIGGGGGDSFALPGPQGPLEPMSGADSGSSVASLRESPSYLSAPTNDDRVSLFTHDGSSEAGTANPTVTSQVDSLLHAPRAAAKRTAIADAQPTSAELTEFELEAHSDLGATVQTEALDEVFADLADLLLSSEIA